jgi:hypothetical protein
MDPVYNQVMHIITGFHKLTHGQYTGPNNPADGV